jgi:hypothetical protein
MVSACALYFTTAREFFVIGAPTFGEHALLIADALSRKSILPQNKTKFRNGPQPDIRHFVLRGH